MDKTCLCLAEMGAMQLDCYSFLLQAAASMRCSCCVKPKLCAVELSSDYGRDWGVLYFGDRSYILMMILLCTDLSGLLRTPKDTMPSCNLLGVVMWEKGFWRKLRGSRLGSEHESSPDLVVCFWDG